MPAGASFPSAVLIFLVLGTIMMGLATPTEAGAMGAIGAIVLAAVRNTDLSTTGRQACFVGGIAAAVIGALIGILRSSRNLFKLAFTVMFVAIVWLCLARLAVTDLRDLIKQAFETTMRITAMVAFILIGATCFSVMFHGRRRQPLGRAPADLACPAASGAS